MKRQTGQSILVLTAFLIGSFAGAAFGVFFALSLNQGWLGFRSQAPAVSAPKPIVLREDAQAVAAVKKVSPSVVSINVMKAVAAGNQSANFPFDQFFFGFPQFQPSQPQPQPKAGQDQAAPKMTQVGGGSGFIISADGMILTNRHVVMDDSADYEVAMQDGKTYKAKVLAKDPVLDLAVLKIDAQGLPVAELGDSDKLQLGETVLTIGNALSEYQNTVAKGVVSGVNRRVVAGADTGFSEVIEQAIQTDAAINPGNSGGPLINLQGQVVGVNTAMNSAGQSIGFAIPIDAAKTVIDSIRATGRIVRPWLGVRYLAVDKDVADARNLPVDYGALVVRGSQANQPAVAAGSPAEHAGIAENDILLEADGVKIDDNNSLSSLISKRRAGDQVTITLLRKGERKTVQATLGEMPATAQ